MKAKEFLQQPQKIDLMIKNKLIEKAQWESLAQGTAISMEEKVQSSGSHDKMADAVIKYVDLEADIDRCIKRLVDKKKAVLEVIEQLDALEYDFLHQVYIQYRDLYDVAEFYGKSYSWATTTHGMALKMVQDIIDKC